MIEPLNNIHLEIMTRELCHEYYREFENDPDIFMDMSLFKKYEYDKERVDEYFDRQKQKSDRIVFAAMLDSTPIGKVILKNIDRERGECSLSIHMKNDSVKGAGYGTQAERLAIKYAFDRLGLSAVNADAVLKNTRSQHILEKIGFEYTGEDDVFKYYRIGREQSL